jgi:hypothetical protein
MSIFCARITADADRYTIDSATVRPTSRRGAGGGLTHALLAARGAFSAYSHLPSYRSCVQLTLVPVAA